MEKKLSSVLIVNYLLEKLKIKESRDVSDSFDKESEDPVPGFWDRRTSNGFLLESVRSETDPEPRIL